MQERSTSEGTTPVDGPRYTAFRVIAWIMAIAAIGFGIVNAGTLFVQDMEIHRFHLTVIAVLLLAISAPAAIRVARHADDPLPGLMQLAVIAVAGLATMALSLTVDFYTVPFIVLGAVLWILWLRRPARPPFPRERPGIAPLVLVAAGAVPLVLWSLDNARLQRIDEVSEHAEQLHWVEVSFFALAVLLLGLVGALRPRAFRMSARSAGISLAIAGAASLALSHYASALLAPWGAIALAGGIVFVLAAEWEARRRTASTRPGA
jgi:hypothetical protein